MSAAANTDTPSPGSRPPIFLQTGFRSGGTWLWSRFRALPSVMAYCEPLNEALETITAESIAELTAQRSQLNHPLLDAPYFDEFIDLLNADGIGVRHYRHDFGIMSYFETPCEIEPALRCYLDSLIDHARSRQLQPVLKFTRALGRGRWLRERFPEAKQVLLLRPPLDQFISGWKLAQRSGNWTFLMISLFLASRPEQGPLRELCDRLGIKRLPCGHRFAECTGAYAALAQELTPQVQFAALLGVFIAGVAATAPWADLIIHSDQLATDARVRQHIQETLSAISDGDLDLSAVATVQHATGLGIGDTCLAQAADDVCALFQSCFPAAVEETRRLLRVRPTTCT